VARTTHDRAPAHNGGSMFGFVLMNRKTHETETRRGN
jgi:hypothetical protein